MSCTFQDKWASDPIYKDWLQRIKEKPNFAFCKLCDKTIDLATMGHSALKSHTRGQKHKERILSLQAQGNLNSLITFSSNKTKELPKEAACTSTSSTAGNISNYITKPDTFTAEVWWCLNTIASNHSFHSNENVSFVFQKMFVDSEIAKGFTCGETKTMYKCIFGIAPYFKMLLERNILGEPYVSLFDESLNQELQKKQLDIFVRHWEDNKVLSRYYTSDFLGHACAVDLVGTFESKVEQTLGLTNIVQLSMDGPNVNWSAFDKLETKIEKEYNTKLINIGSCGLHTVHNAVRAGVSATHWDVSNQLSAMHTLFDNVPARREDYEEVTKSDVYPLPFCSHRWVENVKVIERALHVLPNMKVYVEAVDKKKVKHPGTKSYDTIKRMLKDPFIKAKLTFIMSVGKQVESFLVEYQTDKPMIPFLAQDLAELVRNCMDRFVKTSVMEEANTIQKLSHVDVSKKDILKNYKNVDIGFVAQSELKSIVIGKKASELEVMEFKQECIGFLDKLVTKINEKSPISYSLVRSLSCLNPVVISEGEEKSLDKFRRVLNALCSFKRVKLDECDKILSEFKKFVGVVKHNSKFKDFNKSNDRVDVLFYEHMNDVTEYKNVWCILHYLLLLSHGQASVERGFSINKEVSEQNMSEETLVAKRCIKDHIKSIGGLQCVTVTKELLQYAKTARQSYHNHLEQSKVEKERRKKGEKRKEIQEELKILRKKAKCLEECVCLLNADAEKAADKAEHLQSIPHITQSNSLRKKAREKDSELADVKKVIDAQAQLLSNL